MKELGKRETQYFDINMDYYKNLSHNLRIVAKIYEFLEFYQDKIEKKCKQFVHSSIKVYSK